jgi:hypothetical protein
VTGLESRLGTGTLTSISIGATPFLGQLDPVDVKTDPDALPILTAKFGATLDIEKPEYVRDYVGIFKVASLTNQPVDIDEKDILDTIKTIRSGKQAMGISSSEKNRERAKLYGIMKFMEFNKRAPNRDEFKKIDKEMNALNKFPKTIYDALDVIIADKVKVSTPLKRVKPSVSKPAPIAPTAPTTPAKATLSSKVKAAMTPSKK